MTEQGGCSWRLSEGSPGFSCGDGGLLAVAGELVDRADEARQETAEVGAVEGVVQLSTVATSSPIQHSAISGTIKPSLWSSS